MYEKLVFDSNYVKGTKYGCHHSQKKRKEKGLDVVSWRMLNEHETLLLMLKLIQWYGNGFKKLGYPTVLFMKWNLTTKRMEINIDAQGDISAINS